MKMKGPPIAMRENPRINNPKPEKRHPIMTIEDPHKKDNLGPYLSKKKPTGKATA